jgi:hypothetical protein
MAIMDIMDITDITVASGAGEMTTTGDAMG